MNRTPENRPSQHPHGPFGPAQTSGHAQPGGPGGGRRPQDEPDSPPAEPDVGDDPHSDLIARALDQELGLSTGERAVRVVRIENVELPPYE
ncbi:hypothetical protein [Saccharothrix sp. ST-888]|uniref:hypothetical protein n=1 Tax=Saccharothrix sp. ST-888 TaxID=1427391 RepID=UPI0005ED2CF9|nr:hypothetical protein [Saccharothrix sp. ST-888]KJK59336.1 hypothetical protein UK12_04805 [Saccharothrix sp. ST-888]